jgi:hypothetical protein
MLTETLVHAPLDTTVRVETKKWHAMKEPSQVSFKNSLFLLDQINAAGPSVCQPCTEGYYCPTKGMTQPINKCDVGYYCPEGSKTSKGIKKDETLEHRCGEGQYCPLGAAFAIVCPNGYYQDSKGIETLNTKCK